MRHHKVHRKFNRKRDQRTAFLRTLAEALIMREKILTTEARAKEIRSVVEKLITKSRGNTLAARRLASTFLGGRPKVVKKLFDVLGPRFKDRTGGYTRITKVVKRSADGRQSAVIELV
ncbi:50S ribosomal protein L17 [Candidatus Kaiserbacteria bacterium RIFCSPHIGHO2_01_FULL_48_10]|uniref:Large ribosomal subunit protein bL17 n=1 Tax=Candidatus Kaiserbacteria bacterium RIFCSPHIGHO2_01_FULL_48_10 TaxID=1798476 RepID=A0A1F6C2N9_9BACT|nr:MAG: 50S ribosomal protein L17 [Candidatus Kaiserbacteria bacterium RIFCSPHIGHO2_01_FULL_48_10]